MEASYLSPSPFFKKSLVKIDSLRSATTVTIHTNYQQSDQLLLPQAHFMVSTLFYYRPSKERPGTSAQGGARVQLKL